MTMRVMQRLKLDLFVLTVTLRLQKTQKVKTKVKVTVSLIKMETSGHEILYQILDDATDQTLSEATKPSEHEDSIFQTWHLLITHEILQKILHSSQQRVLRQVLMEH